MASIRTGFVAQVQNIEAGAFHERCGHPSFDVKCRIRFRLPEHARRRACTDLCLTVAKAMAQMTREQQKIFWNTVGRTASHLPANQMLCQVCSACVPFAKCVLLTCMHLLTTSGTSSFTDAAVM